MRTRIAIAITAVAAALAASGTAFADPSDNGAASPAPFVAAAAGFSTGGELGRGNRFEGFSDGGDGFSDGGDGCTPPRGDGFSDGGDGAPPAGQR